MPKVKVFHKILCHDLYVVSIGALIALGGGLLLNQFRSDSVPLRYSSKSERIHQAIQKIGSPTATHEAELPSSGPIDELDLAQLREIVANPPRAILLDARPEVFYRLGHIPGAASLSRENFEKDYAAIRARLEKDKGRFIVVYCSDTDCDDSQIVADALVKLGFPKVSVFRGGWNDWHEAHLAEEKAE